MLNKITYQVSQRDLLGPRIYVHKCTITCRVDVTPNSRPLNTNKKQLIIGNYNNKTHENHTIIQKANN